VVGVWSLEVEGRRLLVEVLDVYQLQCILVHVTCASNQIKNYHDPQPLPHASWACAPLYHTSNNRLELQGEHTHTHLASHSFDVLGPKLTLYLEEGGQRRVLGRWVRRED